MDPTRRSATERWFIRRGLPHVIVDYSATEDVFTRATPFLSVVFFLEVFGSFGDRFSGWAQAGVLLAAVAILVGSVAVVNRLRGRRPFQLPDDVGVLELGLFVLVPAVIPLLFTTDGGWRALAVAAANLVLLGLTYVVTSYAMGPMVRFGAVQMFHRLGQVGRLMARTLPLLLLFTTFMFLNAEMWQVASDFSPAYYATVITMLVLAGMGFMAFRLPREVTDLEHFASWEEVARLAAATDAPLAAIDPSSFTGAPDVAPLGRTDRVNVALLVLISQAVQVVLVGLLIGAFYIGFGLLAVREATISQWTTAELDPISTFELAGSTVVVTWAHFAVAGFIAAFSLLQFAVSMTTDSTYRDEFYQDVTGEIREVLAVRAVYLHSTDPGEGSLSS